MKHGIKLKFASQFAVIEVDQDAGRKFNGGGMALESPYSPAASMRFSLFALHLLNNILKIQNLTLVSEA